MTRAQVDQLIQELGAAGGAFPEDHGGRQPISPKTCVLLLLWTLANQESIRSVADRFNVTKSTVIRSNRRLTGVLVGPLQAKHVRWPDNAAAAASMDPSGKLPMVGAIDGCHIPISQPVENHEHYVCRKGFHSIVLQAVCQSNLTFFDLFAGYPGSVHDARVYRNSSLCEALPILCGENFLSPVTALILYRCSL